MEELPFWNSVAPSTWALARSLSLALAGSLSLTLDGSLSLDLASSVAVSLASTGELTSSAQEVVWPGTKEGAVAFIPLAEAGSAEFPVGATVGMSLCSGMVIRPSKEVPEPVLSAAMFLDCRGEIGISGCDLDKKGDKILNIVHRQE